MIEKYQSATKSSFVRFCIVGASGFLINAVLLVFFNKYLKIDIFLSQAFSAEIALFSNFILHHNWTYKSHNVVKTKKNLLVEFHATSWPAILGSSALVTFGVKTVHLDRLVALAISSVLVLFWNYSWTKYVIWKHHDPKIGQPEEKIA